MQQGILMKSAENPEIFSQPLTLFREQIAAWNPDADNYVNKLAFKSNTVYAAGYFNIIGGDNRTYVAAIDATTGNVTSMESRS